MDVLPAIAGKAATPRYGPSRRYQYWLYYTHPHSHAIFGPKWARNGHGRVVSRLHAGPLRPDRGCFEIAALHGKRKVDAGIAPGVSRYPDTTASPKGLPTPVMKRWTTCVPFSRARAIECPIGRLMVQ